MEDPGEVELSPDFEGDGEPAVKAVTALPAKRRESTASDGPETPSGVGAVKAESVERGDKAPHGDAPSEEAGTQDAGSLWVPDRVKKALEKSKSFEDFRRCRPFRFLHSNERDQLAASLKAEAKRARLEVYVESLDRKKDAELNLASPKIFDEVDKSVMDGEWDGFHSGFPCTSFSRVRWRDSPGGPLPVRCSARIYGLPGNTPAQQREADEGTLMATRSAGLHEKQVASCRRREVPEVSTLENPPGSEDSGSAWDLPEINKGRPGEDKIIHGGVQHLRLSDEAQEALVQAGKMVRKIRKLDLTCKGLQLSALGTTRAGGGKGQHRGRRSLP